MDNDKPFEYKLAEETSEKKYSDNKVYKSDNISNPYLEKAPRKVREINLLSFIRIPISFMSLVLAFWLALNLSSIIQSGDITNWMKNWSENTESSFREYFLNGQISTYEGAITGNNDYAGTKSNGEIVTILESESIPFAEEGDMPIAIRRILDAYDLESCNVLAYDLSNYKSLKSDNSEIANYYDVVVVEAEKRLSMLNCE